MANVAEHVEDDLLPQTDFIGDGETYTNSEFYAFSDPSSTTLPYVYDSLTNWPACDAQNITWY